MSEYKKDSLSLTGAVSLGTGVMIGAGIFALLGQVAEFAGDLFPFAFLGGAVIAGFSAYSYVKMSNAFPSAGGVAMYLQKAYGKSTFTAFAALLMALSMIINESLVARTFGTYTLQLFDVPASSIWVPILGVGLIGLAFLVNISGNNFIQKSAFVMALLKIAGILVFALGGLWAAGFSFDKVIPTALPDKTGTDFLSALALSILAYKGFTTITNSGGEIKEPRKNVSRAMVISLIICTVIYMLVAFAVSANLSIGEIVKARDYSMAEAARPAFGKYGLWFTVGIAIIATVSGIIASIFAASRMTAMLTDMKLIPHSDLGLPGNVQRHMLVYVVAVAALLTVFLDLGRIASMGAIFYLVMDIGIHWGVLKNLREEIKPNVVIVSIAILMDAVILGAFIYMKAIQDVFIIIVSAAFMAFILGGEKWFLSRNRKSE
ncbi:MAG: APC family permease [Bacteroidetes bacterium]|nr:APC family permease [Bacteroidota bacterium]